MRQATEIKARELASTFAAEHVCRRGNLQTGDEFPRDIWRKMGETGLFKIGITKIHGGTGGGLCN